MRAVRPTAAQEEEHEDEEKEEKEEKEGKENAKGRKEETQEKQGKKEDQGDDGDEGGEEREANEGTGEDGEDREDQDQADPADQDVSEGGAEGDAEADAEKAEEAEKGEKGEKGENNTKGAETQDKAHESAWQCSSQLAWYPFFRYSVLAQQLCQDPQNKADTGLAPRSIVIPLDFLIPELPKQLGCSAQPGEPGRVCGVSWECWGGEVRGKCQSLTRILLGAEIGEACI